MKVLYFDCFSGISGDMTLGAFIDLGVDKNKLISELSKLNISGYKIEVSEKSKNGIVGTDVDVVLTKIDKNSDDKHTHVYNHHIHKHSHHTHEHSYEHVHNSIHNHDKEEHIHHNGNDNTNVAEHHHRGFGDIKKIIEESTLDEKVKRLSIDVFYNLAKAEGKIHGKPLDEVHFHEVGAIDSIVDIIGVAICINELNIDKIISSPLNVGGGLVKCQHGIIPVPAPATLEVLKSSETPIYTNGVKKELVTPTGAAIIATVAEGYGDIPAGIVKSIGYGCGKIDLDVANVLRVMIIECKEESDESIYTIETNIDDMSGEIAGYTMERLLSEGALDVFYTPIYMKKNRPAYKLTVLSNKKKLNKIKEIILKETSTIGMRLYKVDRVCMDREVKVINTEYGDIKVKVSRKDNIIKISPEYDDCRKIALEKGIAISKVYNAAILNNEI